MPTYYNEIKEGAFFIADAHESPNKRRRFGEFIEDIYNKKLKPTQLFLMGDMYDVLIGQSKESQKLWLEHIRMLEIIAQTIEVYYFEGNHDFSLDKIFKNVKIIPIEKQPLYFQAKDVKVALSHGDCFGDFKYKMYTTILRSRITLFFLICYEKLTNNKIIRDLSYKLEEKKICTKIKNFKEIISSKIGNYKDCKYVAEGHYHQDVIFHFGDKTYINFASFACTNIYYIFTCKEKIEFIPKKF